MDYIDPHHKRIEFKAAEVSFESRGSDISLIFTTAAQRGPSRIVLVERGTTLAALVDGIVPELVLRKIQILERSRRLTLDFIENETLRRVWMHIEDLDTDTLDAALKQMIANRPLLYFRRHCQ